MALCVSDCDGPLRGVVRDVSVTVQSPVRRVSIAGESGRTPATKCKSVPSRLETGASPPMTRQRMPIRRPGTEQPRATSLVMNCGVSSSKPTARAGEPKSAHSLGEDVAHGER